MYWAPELRPKFLKTYCSQCGAEFGPGDHGFSMCEAHQPGYAEYAELREFLMANRDKTWDVPYFVIRELARLITDHFTLEKRT